MEKTEIAKFNNLNSKNELPYVARKIYPFTTENICGYAKLFELDGKSLLTVGSSGDQIFSGQINNAKEIVHIDLNPYSKFYYYLKASAILKLNRNDFFDFFHTNFVIPFFRNNRKIFNIEVFTQIKDTLKSLDYESYLFWNELFQKYKVSKIRKFLFSTDEYDLHTIKNINEYLSSGENYLSLRKKLLNVQVDFITGSIEKTNFNRKFDNIWLSNVCQYINEFDELVKILDKYKKYLNDNGKLLFAYLYGINKNTLYEDSWSNIYDLKTLFTYSSMKEVDLNYILGINNIRYGYPNDTDAILTYKKKK